MSSGEDFDRIKPTSDTKEDTPSDGPTKDLATPPKPCGIRRNGLPRFLENIGLIEPQTHTHDRMQVDLRIYQTLRASRPIFV
jgi:hypothetical protein